MPSPPVCSVALGGLNACTAIRANGTKFIVRHKVTVIALAIFSAALLATPIRLDGTDLISAPKKPTARCKWGPFDAKVVDLPKLENSATYEMAGSPYPEGGSMVGVGVVQPPDSRQLKFSISVRGSAPGQTFSFVAVGINPKEKGDAIWMASWEASGNLQTDKWTTFERDWSLPPGSGLFRILIRNPNTKSIFFGGIHLVVGGPMTPDPEAIEAVRKGLELAKKDREHPPASPFLKVISAAAALKGPAVIHVQIRGPISSKEPGEVGIATFPVPAVGNGQIPLAFKLTSQGQGKVLGYSWRKRSDGRNLVCDVKLQPGTKGTWVQYDALVLVGGPNQRDTAPPVDLSNSKSTDWTRSTACVQSDAPSIQAIADKLVAPGDTNETYARKVMAFVRDYIGKGAPFKALDALAALDCGGTCTNRANLTAALLRARGIPARTVSHMITWSKEPYYEHWITEFWQPGSGWVAVDSMIGSWDPDRRTRVVLGVANQADEDKAFDPLHKRFVMPGAPYMSSLEMSSTLYSADLTDTDAMNTADEVGRFDIAGKVESSLFAEAASHFGKLFKQLSKGTSVNDRYDAVLKAAKTSKAVSLAAVLRS